MSYRTMLLISLQFISFDLIFEGVQRLEALKATYRYFLKCVVVKQQTKQQTFV